MMQRLNARFRRHFGKSNFCFNAFYREDGGRTRLVRMTIYDQIRKNSHSVLDYSNYEAKELPDKLFHQGRVDRF